MTPTGSRLLMLVDADPGRQRVISALAARDGWRTVAAESLGAAQSAFVTPEGSMLDAVIVGKSACGSDPAAVVVAIRNCAPALPLLVISSEDSPEATVEAMRAGATDFLADPVSHDRLKAALDAATSTKVAQGELRPLTEKIASSLGFGEIVGSDPGYRAALAIAAKAARARVPILIEGEAGTGKDMIAEAIHVSSPREKKKMISVNCAAVPSNLIESELFGHEKGAFTGAFAKQTGKARDADGSTLFLDEIDALTPEAQARLMRVIETGEVHPIGARGFHDVDVRIVAATNCRLMDKVRAGRFREDLYYRLATVHISIPPLRDRRGDIPGLTRHLLKRIAQKPGLRNLSITDEALGLLMSYHWPGNVRQLQNVLFRAAVLCESDVLTSLNFPEIAGTSGRPAMDARVSDAGVMLYEPDGHLRSLEAIEADVIRLAIGHYRGRMTEVARRLGIGRSTLYRKLAELGISDAA
jgi:DNA-binding NtrC family response regulator